MNVNGDLSFLSLIMGASIPVQIVMLILIFASLFSWKYIFIKIKTIKTAEENAEEFEKYFWAGAQLKQLYDSASALGSNIGGLKAIFKAGYKEYVVARSSDQKLDKQTKDSVRRAMQVAYNRELDALERHLPFLASVGSVSPYIGLFGTVWGIMNSFIGLSNVAQSTLAQVAPGIAEALIATAIGLFAAIPAVIAYNRFAAKVDRLAIRYESFMEEFINNVDRRS
ncbi:MAG: protein TolQ [Proteobacteria bacterium]|jgi:biopolymer transport protein TolQ|nr:protein TolQ [Pseudomonadota bacterium]MDA1034489.1 protein TolQ [Pseudomonadota bacterium]